MRSWHRHFPDCRDRGARPARLTDFIEYSVLALSAHDEGYDPIEDRLRAMVRHTIETMFEEELAEALGWARYGRDGEAKGRCQRKLG